MRHGDGPGADALMAAGGTQTFGFSDFWLPEPRENASLWEKSLRVGTWLCVADGALPRRPPQRRGRVARALCSVITAAVITATVPTRTCHPGLEYSTR